MVQREGQHLPIHVGVMPLSFEGEELAVPMRGQWAQICPSRIVFIFLTLQITPSAGGIFVCEVR